ncbi:MAG: mechanosensitive ion channel family protein, partial [Elusimicrobiota bacterium]|nr:mechanosensitive ion channel family protein [Elusimicrobiota bacterium]
MQQSKLLEFFLPDHPFYRYIIILAAIFLALILIKHFAKALQWLTEQVLLKKNFIGKSWLTIFTKNKLFSNIFFAFGMAFLASISGVVLQDLYPKISTVIVRGLNSIVVIAITLSIGSALSVISDKFSKSINLPIKGIAQAIKVIFWIITIILIMSIMINKDPLYFLGGLTALSAIILLIFKDSILGLTSGFQLLLNDLVRVGDWIEIPSQRADGEVIDILLTTVRVRNWDNTIVNIPAYDLVSQAFTNWRGMTEAGGRRIKRAINIDMETVRFLN